MPLLCFLRHHLINQGFQSTPSFRKQNQKPSNFTWHLKHEETSHVYGGNLLRVMKALVPHTL